MNTMNVNGQNGVATSANTSFSLDATCFANFAYNKKMEFTELNKTELISFIARPIRMFKTETHFCLEFGNERYCIYIHKNDKGYYVTVHETSSKTVQRPVKEVIRHYCDCFRLTEKKIDNIINCIYDLVADYFYGYHKADITKSDFEKEYTEDLNSPDAFIGLEDASEVCDNNMMACVDKYGQEFIDRVIKEYADVVYNAISDYDLDDTIKYCVRGALDYMEYDPEKKRLVGCSDVPDLGNWDDEEEFCNYFEDAYSFDWDSCQEFYQEYCNDIWHFADEYEYQMEDALINFDNESVFDKMPYEIIYDDEYLKVYIDMDDFVEYLKKNMIFNDSKAQLFKKEDLGLRLYYVLDPDNEDIKKFYNELISMLPMVTDVKLHYDGLYLWYDDMKNMTIRRYFEKHKIDNGWGTYVTEVSINNYVDEFLSPDAVEIFNNLVEKDEDWRFYIDEDDDGDLHVSGNEDCCWSYFDDNAPMVLVYETLINKMDNRIIRIENDIIKRVEDSKYKVLDAFEITNAQGKNSFNVDYDEWWDYVLGETPDWIKDKYYYKFIDVLYDYFVKYAKDYDYEVNIINNGIYLEKSDYNI